MDALPFILAQTSATHAEPITTVQSLWSGYGSILRYQLYGCDRQTLIVKHINPPHRHQHPRGWNTDLSHQRKLRSYQVETSWYQNWAQRCNEHCYVSRCLGIRQQDNNTLILLEDLDTAGFPLRLNTLSGNELRACLSWLADFHACFMGANPIGLWPIGSYWHLDTRPDEWAVMEDGQLKQSARRLDDMLNQARFKTLIHGDAKVANFCFSADRQRVAAVDFQYVGGGCGMKDVAYFLGSCLSELQCEQLETECLDFYFSQLRNSLECFNITLDFTELEAEWRSLFPVVWADFYRFLQGWMPGHKKINSYSTRITEKVLAQLD